jgi:hypothetical protein
MAQSSTLDICGALDASNSKTLAKFQPGGWVDAHCCERVEDLSCDGAGIANDDGMNGNRTPSSTEQGILKCSMSGKRLFPDVTVEFKVRCILEFDDADPELRPVDQADVRVRVLLVARQHPCRKRRVPLHTDQTAGFRHTPGITCDCAVFVHAFQHCKQDS